MWLRAVQWYLACSALFWEHLLCCQLETFQLLWIKRNRKNCFAENKRNIYGRVVIAPSFSHLPHYAEEVANSTGLGCRDPVRMCRG